MEKKKNKKNRRGDDIGETESASGQKGQMRFVRNNVFFFGLHVNV